MTFRLIRIRRYKRGAYWNDGTPRMCTRCGLERTRRQQATTTGFLVHTGSPYKVPVAYCPPHTPEELTR